VGTSMARESTSARRREVFIAAFKDKANRGPTPGLET
jgi:hypothetical protein